MKVSVIIPTYNRCKMLEQSIISVLSQKNTDIEIIVVDDNSKDETSTIVKKYPQVKYIHNERNMGPGYNRKRGFIESTGEYIVFMDDDDYYTDFNFFENAGKTLNDNPNLSFVSANASLLYVESGVIKDDELGMSGIVERKQYLNSFMITKKKPLSTFTTVFRKSSLLKSELTEMKEVNDASIYIRALLTGDAFILPQHIGNYRIHPNNISKTVGADLIIRNLREKNEVAKKYPKCFYNPRDWFFQQYIVTYGYFLKSTPSTSTIIKTNLWALRNGYASLRLYYYCLKNIVSVIF